MRKGDTLPFKGGRYRFLEEHSCYQRKRPEKHRHVPCAGADLSLTRSLPGRKRGQLETRHQEWSEGFTQRDTTFRNLLLALRVSVWMGFGAEAFVAVLLSSSVG